jgi:ABC-type multidrug transport system fused ATPase/permease subunit
MRFYLRAISYFRPDLPKIILMILMIGISTGAGLLQAYPLAILIDCIGKKLPPQNAVYRVFFAFAPADAVGQIIALAAITLGLRIIQELLQMTQTLLNIQVGYGGLMRVRCDVFRKLQELSLAYHKSQPQGDAIYRVTWDTSGFQSVLNVLVQGILVSGITLVIMSWLMFSMNWKLTLVALSIAPLLLWTTKIYAKILKTKSLEAKEVESALTTTIQRSVATVGLVQAFGREADEYERFHGDVRSFVSAYLRLHWQEVLYWLFVGSIFGLGGAIIFGYGGYLAYRDELVHNLGTAGMTFGKLMIFLMYLVQLYTPLNKLASSGASIQTGAAGVQRVFDVLDRDPIIRDAHDAIHLPRQPRMLEFADVSFEYRPGAPVLETVNCTIRPGEMVAFVGSSGVGKTTLLNLLPRFYDPTSGALKLDGHDLRKIKLKDLRKHIALVLQENVILPATVTENIAYGWPDATIDQIKRAAELAGAASFIDKLPNNYEEEITESGQNLSGGQKQRISIARALLTEAPIIVMDEPTSALDAEHEQQIIQTLKNIKGQRTIILVSHRLSTVAECDQIFVMHEGRIVEQGTHEQLVAQRGQYFRMARHQMKLEEQIPQISQIRTVT